MKTIITSASLAALGAISIQAAYQPGLSSTERAKPWSVSASLRGFYDDNYTTLPSKRNDGGPTKRDSFGVEVSPGLSLNFNPTEQTLASLSYVYAMRWYEDRENNSADHSHQVNAKLDHAFTENYKIDLSDSFVVAQEPQIIDPAQITLPLRANGDNIRNTAMARFTADFTRLFGTEVGYSNTYYDYEQDGVNSYSAFLDRMEHLMFVNLRYRVMPQTVGIFGYQYGINNHNSDDPITNFGSPDVRDSRSHYIYVGADHTFTPRINASARIGAQYTEYPNADEYIGPGDLDDSSWIPYADVSASYAYTQGSYAQLGIRHSRVQTDIVALDQEATTIYGSINHQITPKLIGRVLGQFQDSSFNQGINDERAEQYYLVGLNFEYMINQFLSAETGYNFDRLDSDVQNRSYTRNRVYIGIRASY